MSDELNKEILLELKKINQQLEELNKTPQGLSNSKKIIALIVGFTVIGPLVLMLLSIIING